MVYELPANGVAFVEGTAAVWGVLKGQLTIACTGDMSIMDDVLYHTDPREDPNSKDVLGLISESDIELDASPHGPNVDIGDETIMAAVMALQWSFKGGNSHAGSKRGTIHLYGALVQEKRGPFGTYLPSGNIKTGWEEDFRWDARLAKNPPPCFPTTQQIYKVSWEEVDPSSDITANVW